MATTPRTQMSVALSLGELGGRRDRQPCCAGKGCCERPRQRLALTLTPNRPFHSPPPRRPNPSPSQSLPGQRGPAVHPPGAGKPARLLIRVEGLGFWEEPLPGQLLCPQSAHEAQPREPKPLPAPRATGSPGSCSSDGPSAFFRDDAFRGCGGQVRAGAQLLLPLKPRP